MSFKDSDLRRMSANIPNSKKLFFYDSDDDTATSSARDYFNSIVGEMDEGDTFTLKNGNTVRNYTASIDRDNNVSLSAI